MQENATQEELLREIEALKQENADLKTQIEQLKIDNEFQFFSANKARLRAMGLDEEVKNLKALNEAYKRTVEIQRAAPKDGFCQCGCGRPLNQGEKGRRKKFYEDACRKRYSRKIKALKQAEKIYKNRKLRPIMPEKEQNA